MVTTLDEARADLFTQLPNGVHCPCCTQYAKIYRRKINSAMAHALLVMYRYDPVNPPWLHVPTVVRPAGGDVCKLAYWGLIEEDAAARARGDARSGWWRVTNLGGSFARGTVSLPKYARVFDSQLLGLDYSDPARVTIHDALGSRFVYADLMAGL